MDLGSIQAFAESAKELHSSDGASKIELAIFIWYAVKRFTKPITQAVQALTAAHKDNSAQLDSHSVILARHTEQIENHESRINGLEI